MNITSQNYIQSLPSLIKPSLCSNSLFQILYKNAINAENKFLEYDYEQNQIIYTKQSSFTTIPEYHYIDQEIRTLIESQGCFEKKYELHIHHRKYNVFLSYPSKNPHNKSKIDDYFDECIMKIYVWLFISHYYSKQDCSETMNINIYFSSHKKIIDSRVVLDSLHVNSAFTTSCKQHTQLCLYREEEWFKVFIHETFHNLGFDFSDANETYLNHFMGQLFQVDSGNDLRVYETYCEVWAEILNCFFLSFFQCEDKNQCKKMFYNTLKEQITFSVLQIIKILKHNHTTYNDFTNITQKNVKFQEKTYVFSYYILKMILLFYCGDFEKWCVKHNTNLFQFRKNKRNFQSFGKLIQEKYKDEKIVKYIQSVEQHLQRHHLPTQLEVTMRMTLQ